MSGFTHVEMLVRVPAPNTNESAQATQMRAHAALTAAGLDVIGASYPFDEGDGDDDNSASAMIGPDSE